MSSVMSAQERDRAAVRAAIEGDMEAVRSLLEAGADPNAVLSDDFDPCAVPNGRWSLPHLVAEKGNVDRLGDRVRREVLRLRRREGMAHPGAAWLSGWLAQQEAGTRKRPRPSLGGRS